jgi:hypothetical protein
MCHAGDAPSRTKRSSCKKNYPFTTILGTAHRITAKNLKHPTQAPTSMLKQRLMDCANKTVK